MSAREGAVADATEAHELALAGTALVSAAAIAFGQARRRPTAEPLRFRPLAQPSTRVAAAVLSTFSAREFRLACEVGIFA